MSASTNIGDFVRAVSALEVDTLERFDLTFKAIAFTAWRTLILATPVDTGRARGNWQASDTAPVVEVLSRTDPSGGEVLVEGLRVIRGVEPFTAVHFTNNVPYILRLEEGHSRQAPAGMLRLAIQAARSLAEVEVDDG